MFRKRDLEAQLWVMSRTLKLTQDLLALERQKNSLALARIEAQREDIRRLLERIQELASQSPPTRSKTPLYMSESEEDIRFMRDTEQISIAEAEDMLRQLQFDNQTILVDDAEDLSLF